MAQSSGGGSHILDSLPYIDGDFDEDAVNDLIEAEMSRFSPPDYLTKYPKPKLDFENSVFLKKEFARISEGKPIQPIDLARLELQPPPTNRTNDPVAWKEALNNAHAQLEHQYLRLQNLELLQEYGANAWIHYNKYLEGTQNRFAYDASAIKQEVENINKQRKLEQRDRKSVV